MIKLCLDCGAIHKHDHSDTCDCGNTLTSIPSFATAVDLVYMTAQDRLEWSLNGFQTVNNYPQLPKGIKNA